MNLFTYIDLEGRQCASFTHIYGLPNLLKNCYIRFTYDKLTKDLSFYVSSLKIPALTLNIKQVITIELIAYHQAVSLIQNEENIPHIKLQDNHQFLYIRYFFDTDSDNSIKFLLFDFSMSSLGSGKIYKLIRDTINNLK